MDQSLVHTFSWGNSYGPMVLKVLQKFPPTWMAFPRNFQGSCGIATETAVRGWPQYCRKLYWTKMDQNGPNDHFGRNDLIPNRIFAFVRPKWTKTVHFGLERSILVHSGPPTVLRPFLSSDSNRHDFKFLVGISAPKKKIYRPPPQIPSRHPPSPLALPPSRETLPPLLGFSMDLLGFSMENRPPPPSPPQSRKKK